MNTALVFRIVGLNTGIVGCSMLLPILWAMYYDSNDFQPLLISALITILFGFALHWLLRKEEGMIRYKEGFAIVTFSWLFAGIFGALPFMLSGVLPGFPDAFFETVSGFTTTGASVITNVEAVPPGILFWRSETHWLGGMGIVVLFVALLSSVGSGGFQIFRAESTGLTPDKIKPTISETAKILWYTYLLLTLSQILLLMAGGMNFFDSLCHTFGTVATGGFSTKNASIGYYDSLYIRWVITIFMFLSGVNFALYYAVYHYKNIKIFLREEEFRLYGFLILAAGFVAFYFLSFDFPYASSGVLLADSFFQVVSVMTTTGYATTDYNQWPLLIKMLLFSLMFVGGCAGSTGGSIKVGRILILLKQMLQEFNKMIHPRMVSRIKVCNKVVEEKQVINILQFFFIFVVIAMVSAIILSIGQVDFITALTASAATLTNVGPGFGEVGPVGNYAFFSDFSKIYMAFLMLLGRLELYTVLVLLSPVFWKK